MRFLAEDNSRHLFLCCRSPCAIFLPILLQIPLSLPPCALMPMLSRMRIEAFLAYLAHGRPALGGMAHGVTQLNCSSSCLFLEGDVIDLSAPSSRAVDPANPRRPAPADPPFFC